MRGFFVTVQSLVLSLSLLAKNLLSELVQMLCHCNVPMELLFSELGYESIMISSLCNSLVYGSNKLDC